MKPVFKAFDFASFWEDSEYALQAYVSEPPPEELIASIEEELGYKLPQSYIALMKMHNGGIPVNSRFPTKRRTIVQDSPGGLRFTPEFERELRRKLEVYQ